MSHVSHRLAVAGLCVALVVTGVLLVSAAAPVEEASTSSNGQHWVRTRLGWQVASWEHPRQSPRKLHPLVVAGFLVLASAAVMSTSVRLSAAADSNRPT